MAEKIYTQYKPMYDFPRVPNMLQKEFVLKLKIILKKIREI